MNIIGKTPFHLFAAVLLLAASFNSRAESGLLFVTNSFVTGSNPFSVVAADVNGDGRPDLISANDNDPGSLTVLTNNGWSGFGLKTTLPVGSNPKFVAAANVDGSSGLDLISANAGGQSLSVLTNRGDGTFGSNATIFVGAFVTCVIVIDVNDDQHPDLIYPDNNVSTLVVLTNNGHGRFGFSSEPVVGNYPFYIVAADVNNDDHPDLISVDQDDDALTILTNNGSGMFGFSDWQSVDAGSIDQSFPYCVAAADVNGDDWSDLISANEVQGTLTVLTNRGGGTFAPMSVIQVGNNEFSAPYYVAAADMDGDRRVDLISANYSEGAMTVLTNHATGFGLKTNVFVGLHPTSVVAIDLNGDGLADLAAPNAEFDGTITTSLQLTRPELSLHITEAQLILSWTSSFPNFQVKTNGNLASPVWGTASYPVTVTGGTNYSVIIAPAPSAAAGKLFFRLQYQ